MRRETSLKLIIYVKCENKEKISNQLGRVFTKGNSANRR